MHYFQHTFALADRVPYYFFFTIKFQPYSDKIERKNLNCCLAGPNRNMRSSQVNQINKEIVVVTPAIDRWSIPPQSPFINFPIFTRNGTLDCVFSRNTHTGDRHFQCFK